MRTKKSLSQTASSNNVISTETAEFAANEQVENAVLDLLTADSDVTSASEEAETIVDTAEERSSFKRTGRKAAVAKGDREVTFDIKQQLAVLSISNSGWQRELNIVAWNQGLERFDIRDWNKEHTKMSRGIGLNKIEVKNLLDALNALERLGAI